MAEDIRELVKKITEEVLKQLSLKEAQEDTTLAVFPEYIFDAECTADYFKKKHENTVCALLGDSKFEYGLKTEKVVTQQEKDSLSGRLYGFKRIVIASPPLWLLKAITKGDDTVYPAMLALRPLLWGQEVIVLLDFDPPKSRRSPVFIELAENISMLEEMGIKIVSLKQECAEVEGLKDLVTEQDVKDAAKSGITKIGIKQRAIVTQLARDTAKELGVIIEM